MKQNPRFIATIWAITLQGNRPLFDMVVYGGTVEDAKRDLVATKEVIEYRLRLRNLSLDDFGGVSYSAPPEMPTRTSEHVWT